jgi:hypothetical protein
MTPAAAAGPGGGECFFSSLSPLCSATTLVTIGVTASLYWRSSQVQLARLAHIQRASTHVRGVSKSVQAAQSTVRRLCQRPPASRGRSRCQQHRQFCNAKSMHDGGAGGTCCDLCVGARVPVQLCYSLLAVSVTFEQTIAQSLEIDLKSTEGL